MQNVSVGDKSAVQGGGFSPPTPHLTKNHGSLKLDRSTSTSREGSLWKMFNKKIFGANLWAIKDERRRKWCVFVFILRCQIRLFGISSDPIAWVKEEYGLVLKSSSQASGWVHFDPYKWIHHSKTKMTMEKNQPWMKMYPLLQRKVGWFFSQPC